jgi:hypothetical protein
LTTQEHEQLLRFLQELTQARVGHKDADAEKLILEACSQQSDAAYLLVQRCLLLGQALRTLEGENAQLKQDLASVHGSGGNFLSVNDWGNSASAAMAPRSVSSVPPQPVPVPSPVAAPLPAPAGSSAWGGSGMLGAVATTAAGVVAGSFLFQGIEHLMGNHAGGSGLSGGQRTPLAEVPAADSYVSNESDYALDAGSDLDSLVPSDSDLDSV